MKPLSLPVSTLVYGPPGSGKTALAVSSFWDWRKREPVEGRTGRLLLIGREDNPALGIPEEFIKRFPRIDKDPTGFVTQFDAYMTAALRGAKKAVRAGEPPPVTDFVLDGLSEFNYLFVFAQEETGTTRWDAYSSWRTFFIKLAQMLNPQELNANVFATARVGEKRKATESKGKKIKGDPDWLDFNYMPALEGWSKYNAPHYFNFVLYMEQEREDKMVGGKKVKMPYHALHMLATGDYEVKNVYEHIWLERDWPLTLRNPVWADVEERLREVQDNGS